MMRKSLLSAAFIISLVTSLFAAEEKLTVTTFYPSPNGIYKELKAVSFSVGSATGYINNHAISDGYALVSTRLGIGTTSPASALEVANNQTIKIGAAYLSSGGNYAHLATNEYFNGSAWVVSAEGLLLQLSASNGVIYYHTAGGAHTQWAYIGSTSGWTISSSRVYKQNIRKLGRKDYDALREQFRKTDLFSYNRKDAPKEPEVGFIAEESPELILDSDKSRLTLLKTIGYCAAIARGREDDIRLMEKEVNDLKSEIKKLKKIQGKSSL